MHVPDTAAVLSEVKRVLKPGGIVASRELFEASSFLEPSDERTDAAWATFSKLLAANGGHPQMGKELKNRFLEAGFTDIRAGGSLRLFRRSGGRGIPEPIHKRLVLFAECHRSGNKVRHCHPRAFRHV